MHSKTPTIRSDHNETRATALGNAMTPKSRRSATQRPPTPTISRQSMSTIPLTFAAFAMLLWAGLSSAKDLSDYEETPSFVYRNVPADFQVSYPAHWVSGEASGSIVRFVHHPDLLPAMRVLVLDEPWWLPLRFSARAAQTQLSDLGRDIELIDARMEEWNGVRVNIGEVHWTMNIGLGLPLRTIFVSTFHNNRWIMLNLITGTGEGTGETEFPEELKAVAETLVTGLETENTGH